MYSLYLTSITEYRIKNDSEELEELIKRTAVCDSEAFEQLYRITKNAVYGFSLSILKNAHDAEDVLHDTYVKIYTSAVTYTPCGKPMAWIFTIARNLSLGKLRKLKNVADIEQEDWERLGMSDGGGLSDERIVLRAAMETLSDEERQIVMLHSMTGLKFKEISEIVELPLSTVLSKYHRALKKLKKILTGGE